MTRKNSKDFAQVRQRLADARGTLGPAEDAQVLTVTEQFEAIRRGDFAAALRHAHEDIELEIHAPPEFPLIRKARGHAQVQRAIEQNFTMIEDQQPIVSNVLVQGDVLVLIGSERGVIAETQIPYSVESVHRFTFSEGKLRSIRIIVARA